jgi:Polyketide cyclase / dehydrase and lipid transport
MVVLYILLGLIIGLLVMAIMLPPKYHIEHFTVIKRSLKDVMGKVSDLNYYAKWNPWQLMEKEGKYEITGIPKTPGHRYSWQGKKTGIGSLTLRDLDDRHVHFDLEFIKPWKAKAKDDWVFEEWGSGETKVTWQNNGSLPFPLARLMGPMLKKSLNKQFGEGLKNLKTLCEGYSA